MITARQGQDGCMIVTGEHFLSTPLWDELWKLLPDICRYPVLDNGGVVIGLKLYSPDGHRESKIMKQAA